jgi:hypothetical protein
MDQYEYEQLDNYTKGWADADEQIRRKLNGERVTGLDYSQGDSDWDKGWNARLDLENKVD